MQRVFRIDPAVEYSFVPSPPKARLILSTYSINSNADFLPIYSYSVPPKSLVILYLPSENAPAPPKPLIIEQFLQWIQDFTLSPSIGQWRFVNSFPISKTAIFKSGLFSNNSYAVNIPPGPAPTITTSYIMFPPIKYSFINNRMHALRAFYCHKKRLTT